MNEKGIYLSLLSDECEITWLHITVCSLVLSKSFNTHMHCPSMNLTKILNNIKLF